MRLGINLGYWGAGPSNGVALAQEAERLGFDSAWTAEAYGSDALTPLTWVGALTSKLKLGTGILQISARTPAMTASTACYWSAPFPIRYWSALRAGRCRSS